MRKIITKIRMLRPYHTFHCRLFLSAWPTESTHFGPRPFGKGAALSDPRPLSSWLSSQIYYWKNTTPANKPTVDTWGQRKAQSVRRESLVLKTKLSTSTGLGSKTADIKHLPKSRLPFSWEEKEKKKKIGYDLTWKDFMSYHLNLRSQIVCCAVLLNLQAF